MKRTYSLYSFPVPDLDLRLHKPTFSSDRERDIDWLSFKQANEDMLRVYNIVIKKILSHSIGIHLDDLRSTLRIYLVPGNVIDKVIHFMITNSKDVELKKASEFVNLPIVYLKPKLPNDLPAGPYSVFIPHSRK